MMISDAALLFLIAHFIGDYYFAISGPVGIKEPGLRAVLAHSLYYGLSMLLVSAALTLYGNHWYLVLAGLVLSVLHLLADILVFAGSGGTGTREAKGDKALYLADQLVHWAAVLVVIDWLYIRQAGFEILQPIPRDAVKWVLLLLAIHKPGNMTFKRLFHKYEDRQEEKEPSHPGAGALIGSLERVLCAIFIALGQYAAIGLIYTAKSIARFKKIEQNQRFAEYYLIGTLYSILFVLVAFIAVMRVIR